jgi:hypothetical protein
MLGEFAYSAGGKVYLKENNNDIKILKCFARDNLIKTFFDLIDCTDLGKLFDEVGSDIIYLALVVRNSLSINFIADKVPRAITKTF